MSNKIQHHTKKAYEFLMQEYDHFKEFREDLEKLHNLLDKTRREGPENYREELRVKIKAYEEIFKDFNYVGRSERRFNRFLVKVEGDIKKLIRQQKDKKKKEELTELEEHMEIGGKAILAAASLHEGRIRQQLNDFQEYWGEHNIDLQRSYSSSTDRYHEEIYKIQQLVKRTITWMAALTRDLQRAQRLSAKSIQEIGPQSTGFYLLKDNLELSKLACVRVSVVDFSALPTGTHKFLKAAYLMKQAQAEPKVALGAITAGNYGLALKTVHQTAHMQRELHLFLDKKVNPKIIRGLKGGYNVFVHAVDLSKGWFGQKEMEAVAGKEILDLTNLKPEQVPEAYKKIDNVVSSGAYYATHVFCPVGSGEFLAAFNLEKNMKLGMKVYGVVPQGHPFQRSHIGFKPMPQSKADSLVTPWMHPNLYNQILSKHFTCLEVTERDIQEAYRLAKKCGYDPEVSGAVGFVGVLPKYIKKLGYKTDCSCWHKITMPIIGVLNNCEHVAIISTGNGHKHFGI